MYLAETEDYRRIFDHLRFDQQSYMQDKATADRARQLGLMERQLRSRTGAAELGALIAAVEAIHPDESTDFATWAIARVARRDHETELRRPMEPLAEFQRTASEAFLAWRDARKTSNWAAFAPWLRKIIEINVRLADAIGYAEHPMDALLSIYEPGLSWRQTQTLLDTVRDIVIPLNARRLEIVNTLKPDPVPVLARDRVFAFVHDLAENLGYDWERGGLSISPHPFTSPSGANDVRFTLRDDVAFPDLLKTAVHELGHALYEQGVSPELWGTAAARGIMPYVHESQAKFWENSVGREPAFAVWAYDMLRPYLDDEPDGFGPEALHRAALYGPTSLIRTGSDELSFNLHIILRWEIECALLTGEIDVMDVPALWNARSMQYFGQRVPDDSAGCLQDPHWCHRYMGLFTAYTIGNVMAAQLAQAMEAEGIKVKAALEARDVSPLLGWLRRNVHAVGRTYTLTELIDRVTGSPLAVDAFRELLTRRYGAN